ncbi:MAG: hypothetical protein PHE56_08545 [Bacteroidales bacterium]|nr:hypothetical protein [Bacteroidales bacterium]
MRIVNPLYDLAFKYLMENEKYAKKVLSVILDVDVIEVELGQQEMLFPKRKPSFNLFRLDFKAVIVEADGSRKTVLIELQKSKYASDIQRFRNYLGANYMVDKKDFDISSEPITEYSGIYPLITIYILGYNIEELPYMAVTVNREVTNSVSKERLTVKCDFIELLTHQSHIIQVKRLPENRKTRLEKFFTLFNQAWCVDSGYVIDLQDVPEEFGDVAKYLQAPLEDEKFRRYMLVEDELDYVFDQQEKKYKKQLEELELEKREAKKGQRRAEKQKLEIEKQKQEAEKQKQEAENDKHLAICKLATFMKKSGFRTDEIITQTGLSAKEIELL